MKIPSLNNDDPHNDLVPRKKEAMMIFDDLHALEPNTAPIALIESDLTNYIYTYVYSHGVSIYRWDIRIPNIYGIINAENLLKHITRSGKCLDSTKILKSINGIYSIESLILNIQKTDQRIMKSRSREAMLIKKWLSENDLLYKKGMAI